MLQTLEKFADDMLPKYVEMGGEFPAVIVTSNIGRDGDVVRGMQVICTDDYPTGFAVIVSRDDFLITNDHVMALPKKIDWEGKEFFGKIEGEFECRAKQSTAALI